MRTSRWSMVAALTAVLLVGGNAWAGEVKVGTEPLEVDDSGNLTKAGREKAVAEIESAVPGDELWRLHLWAKLDKPALGPLYLEFYRDRDGQKLMAHRVEIETFDGNKFFSMDVEISRTEGSFVSGETVEVAFVQSVGGKDQKKASGKIKLLASSKPAPTKPAATEPEEEEKDPLEEEEIKERSTESEPSGGPPPVESGDKKGCTLGGTAPPPALALFGLVALRRRRR